MTENNKLPISRAKALNGVILILKNKGTDEEIIKKLDSLAKAQCIAKWSKDVLEDCIDDFYIDNGRLPTVSDLKVENGLPCHTVFRWLFGISAGEWLREKQSAFVIPKISCRKALLFALENCNGEIKQKVIEVLEDYPITKWNNLTIMNSIITYYEIHNKVPTKRDFEKDASLPNYGVFKRLCKTTYLKWLKEKIPFLYNLYSKKETGNKNYLDKFVKEYKRLCPKNGNDFNKRRDRESCPTAWAVANSVGVKGWKELLELCGLDHCDLEKIRIEKECAKIKSLKVISVDCGENLFFREYSKNLEREVILN